MPVLLYYLTQDMVDRGVSGTHNAETLSMTYSTTWDALFAAVAPSLIDEASRRSISGKLNTNAYVESYVDAENWPNVAEVVDIDAGPSALEDFEVQFFSLGLIERSEKRHPVTDKNSYWTLTEVGKNHLMRIRAARRAVVPPVTAA